MKAKTIKSVLSRKHNALLKSIDDPNIKHIFENEAIITGGSIASMLLNEKVSDFDYYFTNQEAAREVADYYLSKFRATHDPENLRETRVALDKETGRVRIEIPSSGILSEKEFKSGAADLLPESELEQINSEAAGLDGDTDEPAEIDGRFRPVFLSSNAITLSNKVQIVIRFYGEPDQIHENYDFEHCKCYWVARTGELKLPERALLCLLNKELLYTGSRYPLCSIIRTRKFIQRGWQINAGQYVKMALHLNSFDLLDPDVLEDQLTGVDVAYFMQVINSIKRMQEEKPDFELKPEYLIEVIDRLFN